MRKLFLSLVFMHVCMALEVFDKPMPNANLLIIGDASNLQLLNDNYVHVFDPKTKIKGYVRYDEFQKALLTSNLKKQYPQMSNILGKEFLYTIHAIKKDIVRNECNEFFNYLSQQIL